MLSSLQYSRGQERVRSRFGRKPKLLLPSAIPHNNQHHKFLTLSTHLPPPSSQLPIVPRTIARSIDEPYESHDPTPRPLLQRQQRQLVLSPQVRSRPSSSTGSNRTLRRTPNLQVRRITSKSRLTVRTPENRVYPRQLGPPLAPSLSDSQASSASPQAAARILRNSSYWPLRSNRISKRTAESILYALEAIRGDPEGRLGSPEGSPLERQHRQWKPKSFTPNQAEENASMADLMGGGAANGRSQNGGGLGPVPVPQAPGGDTGRATPPTEIMARRRAREARKREESERQQREQAEARRRVQEQDIVEQDNNAAAAGVGPSGDRSSYRRSGIRTSAGDPVSQPTAVERRPGDRGSGGSNRGTDPAAIRAPSGRTERLPNVAQDPISAPAQPRTRQRGATLSTGQPRPVETTRTTQRAASGPALGSLENQASQTRQTSKTAGTSQPRFDRSSAGPSGQPQAAPQAAQEQTPRSNTSSFPHAFERWEQLSSHWEGLTSFWIRRLEQNKEDLDREPLNQQMARQVTDLSAAGANLFHAVVELQRLRASSERKFQRWFFETRADQERARETQAKLEEQLQSERQARTETATNSARYDNEIKSAYAAKSIADVQVKEMRRELAISKDEARRAWEELGRREQEERDRTVSLKSGHITVVGGVQVVPMSQNSSRQGTGNRSSTRDGQSYSVPVESPSNEPGYTTYDPARSDTDTDPFTESGRANAELPPVPSSQAYQQTSNTSSAAVQAARGVIHPAPQSQPQGTRTTTTTTTTSGGGTYLRYGPDGPLPTSTQPATSFYQHEGTSLHPDNRPTSGPEGDGRSYVPSVSPSLSQDEYEMDSNGEVRRDPAGNPILSRRGIGSEDSDEYNVTEQLERERMYGRSYGSGMPGVEYGPGPTTSAGSRTTGAPADYEGSGYGVGWEAMPRHHHPSRLSDVLEEDERSRTSPSRASQNSRGIR